MSKLRWSITAGLAVVLVGLAVEPSLAGATRGQRRWSQKVEAKASATFNIEFAGGRTAEFAIIGDSDTDVDIYVYDAKGVEVTKDIGLSDLGMARWTPSATQTYRIEVRNLGNVWNMVHMGHN